MVKQQPALKKRQLSLKQRKNARISYGEAGETLATRFLSDNGYTILERNLRINTYEVDIIALDPHRTELVFIEVKRRASAAFGDPEQAVTYKKIRSMRAVAHAFLQKCSFSLEYRFDIIAITGTTIAHFKNIDWST